MLQSSSDIFLGDPSSPCHSDIHIFKSENLYRCAGTDVNRKAARLEKLTSQKRKSSLQCKVRFQ